MNNATHTQQPERPQDWGGFVDPYPVAQTPVARMDQLDRAVDRLDAILDLLCAARADELDLTDRSLCGLWRMIGEARDWIYGANL